MQEIAIQLETGDVISAHFSEDLVWERSLEETVRGRDELVLKLSNRPSPSTIFIEHAISHGRVGAASGEVTLGGGQKRRFSHILEFTNTKANCVAVVKSYT